MRAREWFVLSLAVWGAVACAPQHGTIGAILAQSTDGTLTVHDVPEGLAASEGGLQPGDQILLIDGHDVRAMNSAAVHQLLTGAVGEPVKLTVVRGDEIFRVTLHRTPATEYQGE